LLHPNEGVIARENINKTSTFLIDFPP